MYMVGALVMLLSKRYQRLGDLAAGTIVVKVQRESSPRLLPPLRPDLELPPQLATAFSPDDVALAREFVLRRNDLQPDRRATLGRQIATRLRQRLGPTAPDGQDEELIARVAALRR
jgi:hypothetical protein